MDIAALAELLHETSIRHGSFEAAAPPHDWWDWYAAYMDARQSGSARTRPPPPPIATWPTSRTSWCRRERVQRHGFQRLVRVLDAHQRSIAAAPATAG